jgi:hypothetical protein
MASFSRFSNSGRFLSVEFAPPAHRAVVCCGPALLVSEGEGEGPADCWALVTGVTGTRRAPGGVPPVYICASDSAGYHLGCIILCNKLNRAAS